MKVGRRPEDRATPLWSFSLSLGSPHHQLRRMQEMLQKMKQQMQDQ